MSRKHTRREFIRLAKEVHQMPNGSARYCYERVKYRGSKVEVEIRCPSCSSKMPKGELFYFWKKPNYHLGSKNRKGQGCPMCTASKMERRIFFILQNLGVEAEIQKTFDDLRSEETGARLRFDFYLPEQRAVIEYNGIFHVNDKGFAKPVPAQAKRFDQKREYARDNGIDFVVFDYTQKNNIVDLLTDYFVDTTLKNNNATLSIPSRSEEKALR